MKLIEVIPPTLPTPEYDRVKARLLELGFQWSNQTGLYIKAIERRSAALTKELKTLGLVPNKGGRA